MKTIWIALQVMDDKTNELRAYATNIDPKTDLSCLLHQANVTRFCIPVYEHAARDVVKQWNVQKEETK